MKLRIEIREAELIPKWYGLAWREPWKHISVYYIVPLNWVVRIARSLWITIKIPRPWQTELLYCYKKMWVHEFHQRQELEKKVHDLEFKAQMYDYYQEQKSKTL